MANKQALRDLQMRLADRLQVARTQGVAAAWLAVEAGDKKYLFPLVQSGEIFPWAALQPVPYTQGWFVGVANLRGRLVGVVDLAGFVSGEPKLGLSESACSESRFVLLNSALEVNCALWIDRLSGLRNQGMFCDFSGRASDAPDFFGNSYVDFKGVTWQEINLQKLAQEAHFLTIGA
ncbi:MAG: chemotaxis protein CheW [Polaromonas sp.]|nr:chemotaxis protein CheW [Polaromonas sp.]